METNFLEQLTELLEMETPVKPADKFREYENWDSLAYLSLISFVDEEYGIVIPRDKFGQMNTVQEVIDYIKNNS